MKSRWLSVAIWTAALIGPLGSLQAAAADDGATRLRIFLRDGTSLVSYGEPARVGDRVVFSMPTASTPDPPLHLINLPADRVDWERTDKYFEAARAAQYVKSQAELDYTALSGQMTETLNEVASTTSAAERLKIVERARSMLMEWPEQHYHYRQADIRQMVGMLDEAINTLRAATGGSRFDISLSTFSEPPPAPVEPLLPPPTLQESIEGLLTAAHVVDSSIERTSLLSSALASIDQEKDDLPADWATETRATVKSAIDHEIRIDRSYQNLTTTTLAAAERRARLADVRGVERLLVQVRARDAELGEERPEAVQALLGAVEEKLDATRRLRLARDRWELRLPVLAEYGSAIRAPIALFNQLRPKLEDIKALAGSSPAALESLQRGATELVRMMAAIVPPEELTAAHALFMSAAQMAANAVSVRREATLANDMSGAWNASSAAAGALMLGTRARTDILALLRPPQIP
ncbi:MAG TPA: hypothetical protein VH583_16290 [Vicinamibacterales bacterium]|jgi:hypothetical protein